jgi:hypothetical protein
MSQHPIRALDRPPSRHHDRLESRSHALMLAGRMQPRITQTRQPSGQNVPNPTPEKPQARALGHVTLARFVVPVTPARSRRAQDAAQTRRSAAASPVCQHVPSTS